jgi:putative transposase
LLRYFGKRPSDSGRAYREFVEAKIGIADESPLGTAVASSVLGSEEFIDDIRDRYLSGRKKDRNLPALAALTRISPKDIARRVRLEFRNEPALEKKVRIYLSHRFSGVRLKEIGKLFGISESGVSQASRRFETMLATDRRLRKRVRKLQKLLGLSFV